MPRKPRKTKGRRGISPELRALFMVGTGANTIYGGGEALRLWKEHGRAFLDSLPPINERVGNFAKNPLFLKTFGEPEKYA